MPHIEGIPDRQNRQTRKIDRQTEIPRDILNEKQRESGKR